MNQELSEEIIDAALEVHRILGGPGLMENIYEVSLCHELSLRGIKSERQAPIPVKYKNTEVRDPLFLDILVENDFIIEVKATGKDTPFTKSSF
jgi:GxxExxY protein